MTKIKIRIIEKQALDYLNAIANNEDTYIDYGLDVQAKVISDYIKQLQEENQQLRESEHNATTTMVLLNEENKELKEKLQQREEIIEKAIKFIYEETDSMSAGLGIKKCIYTYKLLDILKKYKENK